MGLCAQGPNVMLYPQAIWFSGVALADAPRLLAEIKAVVVKQGCPAQT